jgi:hypothetical protein
LEEEVPGSRLRVGDERASLFDGGKACMLSLQENGVSNDVVPVYTFKFGGAGNGMIAENVRVLTAGRT